MSKNIDTGHVYYHEVSTRHYYKEFLHNIRIKHRYLLNFHEVICSSGNYPMNGTCDRQHSRKRFIWIMTEPLGLLGQEAAAPTFCLKQISVFI